MPWTPTPPDPGDRGAAALSPPPRALRPLAHLALLGGAADGDLLTFQGSR